MLSFRTKPQLYAATLLLGAVLLLGCGGAGRPASGAPEDAQAVVDLTEPGQPIPPERFPTPDDALIGPGDFLDIRVLGYPELTGTFLVAMDGRINLSLVGSVQASGRTTQALDHDLTTAFSVYYRDVDVAVNVNARTERFVYVLGELTRPGRHDFRPGERVIHALADAGGYTNKARENGIILLRREPDGKDHVYRLDFSQLFAQVVPQDIYLQPGDVVFVPKSKFKTAYEFAYDFLDILGRSATSALIIDDLSRRTRNLTIGQ